MKMGLLAQAAGSSHEALVPSPSSLWPTLLLQMRHAVGFGDRAAFEYFPFL